MITQEDSVLVQLIRLVEHIPSPPPPSARRPRGRPIFYPEKLFLKALVIMILRRLHRVGELLAVLDEPTPEMKIVRELLREEGRFPTRRTFQRRLKTLPERLPEQIGCLGRHLVEVLKPANTADNQIAPALIEQLPDEARFVLGDIHYIAPNLREACLHHSSDEERFLVTTKRGTYPHTDLMASKSVASSTSCAAWPTRTSERLTSFLYGLKPNAPQRAYGPGLGNQRGWLGHTGEVPGYTTSLYYNAELHTTMVVEVNSDVSVGDCPPEVPTMTDSPHNLPCSEPSDFVFGELSKELGKPFATKQ